MENPSPSQALVRKNPEGLSPLGRPSAALSSAVRPDPYYEGGWGYPNSVHWPRSPLDELIPAGRRVRTYRGLTAADALDRLFVPRQRQNSRDLADALSVLAVLWAWHACTTQQLAAFVGNTRLLKNDAYLYLLLLRAGLIDAGVPTASLSRHRPKADGQLLWRLNEGPAFRKLLLPRLCQAEVLALTGDVSRSRGRPYARHNVFASEAALRLAEHHNLAAILGERFSRHVDLAPALQASHGSTPKSAGDLTLVLRDGLRIAVELTSAAGEHFRRKVDRWCSLLAGTPGVAVIFLVAPAPELGRPGERRLVGAVQRAVAASLDRHPGVSFDPVEARIGVVTWGEWFPSAGAVAASFQRLVVHRPTARGRAGVPSWVPVEFGSLEVPPPRLGRNELMYVHQVAQLLAQTPYWLRGQPDFAKLGTLASLFPSTRRSPQGAVSTTETPRRLTGIPARPSARLEPPASPRPVVRRRKPR